MEPNEERAIVFQPSHELTVLPVTLNRILGEMVESSLAVAKELTPTRTELDAFVREADRLRSLRKFDLLCNIGLKTAMPPDDEAERRQAFDLYYRAATAGHPEAQYRVSECYFDGDGVEKDDRAGFEWLKRSAESGWVYGQMKLAGHHSNGSGVPQNYTTAAMWYRKAADQGLWKAQVTLSKCYDQGLGVPQDSVEAFKLLRRAAESRGDDIRSELAVRYQTGNGVAVDLAQAYAWFRLAAYGVAKSVAIPDSWKSAPENTREFIMASIWESEDRKTELRASAIEAEATTLAAKMSPPELEVAKRRYSEILERYSAKRSRRERR